MSILTLFTKHFEGQEREGIIFGHSSSSGGTVVILTRRLLYIRALLIHITDNLSEPSLVRHGTPVITAPARPCLQQQWPSSFSGHQKGMMNRVVVLDEKSYNTWSYQNGVTLPPDKACTVCYVWIRNSFSAAQLGVPSTTRGIRLSVLFSVFFT